MSENEKKKVEKRSEKRAEKRKLRKEKVIIVLVAIVVIIVLVVGIVLLVKHKNGKDGKEGTVEQAVIYDLPDITYSEMQVTNIEMEYLKNNNETMVSMIINNTTNNTVSKESLTAYLIDKDGKTLGQTRTYIESLAPGEQYSISVILKGDLTATTQINLQK